MPEVKTGTEGQGAFSADQTKFINDSITAGVTNALKGFKVPSAEDLGKLVDGKLTGISEALAKLTESQVTPPVDPKDGKDKGVKTNPEDQAKINDLTKRLDAVTKSQADSDKKREEAEQRALATDKESKIQSVLQEFEFTSDGARKDAYQLINGLITRDNEGNLLGQDNLPYDAFIRTYVPDQKGYLLAPLARSGSGAQGGSNKSAGAANTGGKFQIEQIKPGMSKEELGSAVRAIRQALPSTGV